VNEPTTAHFCAKPARKSACHDATKITEPKLADTQCGFRRGRSTTEQISTPANFREILEACQRSIDIFYRPRESMKSILPGSS